MISRDFIEKVKIGLIVATIAALIFSYVLAVLKKNAKKNKIASEWLKQTPLFSIGKFKFNAFQSSLAAFFFLAIAGTYNYAGYSHLTEGTSLDEYDLMHYYISAKYFDELGYYNLLPAIVNADYESGRHCASSTKGYLHQGPDDYVKKPISFALTLSEKVKSRFTPKRWKQFVHDTMYLQRVSRPMGCKLWRQLLWDHGFNGTPTWVFIARPLAQNTPVESLRFIVSLDILWLAAALFAIGWAFGPRTAAFSWIFLTICYSVRWPTAGWAMLRYDWISATIIGLSMLKKEKYTASGAFFAYATLMRYFPGIWLFAIAAKGIHALVTNKEAPLTQFWKRIPMKYYKMAMGFFVVITILLTASISRDGIEAHRQSLENIASHVQPHNLSSRRMGMVIAAVYRGELDLKWISDEKKAMVASIETQMRVLSLVMILLLGLFISRLKDWEAVGLGFMPFFWLTTSSYYYYVVLLSGVVIHAKAIHKKWHLFGIIMLFLVQLSMNTLEHVMPGMRYPNISIACVLLTIHSAGVLIFLGHNWWTTRPSALAAKSKSEAIATKKTARKPSKK
ncbi:MAG: hypothetical protein JXX29_03005 [Deltaproteobacteria bacterium]|nr:hypothetical protein [Deltaproteobacteria bacterium]MBN2670612.1 hypothetical protein [Deltaproteobacteria bacterium]